VMSSSCRCIVSLQVQAHVVSHFKSKGR
jgi:hypothetical protein